MKTMVALVLSVAWAATYVVPPSVFAQRGGSIVGTARGAGRALAGVTVQVVNARGEIVKAATTASDGGFTIEPVPAGTFILNLVGSSGRVIVARAVVVADGIETAVTLEATAASLERAAAAAGAGASATDLETARAQSKRGISARAALLAIIAAAIGVSAIVATGDEASGRR